MNFETISIAPNPPTPCHCYFVPNVPATTSVSVRTCITFVVLVYDAIDKSRDVDGMCFVADVSPTARGK